MTSTPAQPAARVQSLRILAGSLIGALPLFAVVAVVVLGTDEYPSAFTAAVLFGLNVAAFAVAEAVGGAWRHRGGLATGWPVLMALSNKDFVGETLDRGVGERVAGTLAATAWSAARGVAAFRVHEVAETADVIRMTAAIQGEVAPLATTRGLA